MPSFTLHPVLAYIQTKQLAGNKTFSDIQRALGNGGV